MARSFDFANGDFEKGDGQVKLTKASDASPATVGASMSQSIFNLVKNIVGSGVLSLPAGLAAGTGVIPALMLSIILGSISAYCFSLVGRVCDKTGKKTFKDLGEATSGSRFAYSMAVVCTLKTFMTCLSYSIVLSDSFSSILRGCSVPDEYSTPNTVLLYIMALIVMPMCLMKDLSLLSYTSLAGISGMLYTTVFVTIRCFDGTYEPGGLYYNTAKFKPDFGSGTNTWTINIKTLVLLCALSTAFIAHYNAPKFYCELRDRSIRRFNFVVAIAFGIALLIFMCVMLAGYFTFGRNAQGLILNNYSDDDILATLARACVGLSTICTYPLAFTGLRDGSLSLLGLGSGDVAFYSVTATFLILITILAWFIDSLGFVNNFGGAVFGASIIYIFPSMLFLLAAGKGLAMCTWERPLTRLLIGLGAFLVFLGSVVATLEEYYPAALG